MDPETLKHFQIWKVIEQNTKENVDEKNNNLMLFHGTSHEGVAGILKNGFKNSENGKFGNGVYMTESSDTASYYSNVKLFLKNVDFIFINEVLKSENLQTFVYKRSLNLVTYVDDKPINSLSKYTYSSSPIKRDTPLNIPFTKYMDVLSSEITEENYKEDPTGRRYRNIAVDENSMKDEFIADADVVVPRYLISYENKVIPTKKYLILFSSLIILSLLVFLVIKSFIKKCLVNHG